MGFSKSKADSNLYYKVKDGNPVMLLLYVDDLFVIGMDGLIANTKRKLVVEFEMKVLGMMHYFLGMEVWQSVGGIFLGQGKYAVEILKRFGLILLNDASSESVDATMYRQMIGSLMYLMNTRLNICFVVNTLRQFLMWKLNPGLRTITLTKISNYTCKLHTKDTEYGAKH